MYKNDVPEHSRVSLKTVRIEAFDHENKSLGHGTGFWFLSEDDYTGAPDDVVTDHPTRVSLVTNFHIVSGKSTAGPWVNGCNDQSRPFFLKIQPSTAVEHGTDRNLLPTIEFPVLIETEGGFRRAWYSKYKNKEAIGTGNRGAPHRYLGPEHFDESSKDLEGYPFEVVTDIAVIPISEDLVQEYGLRELAWEWDARTFKTSNSQQWTIQPTDSVYVLGYPHSVEGFSPTLPIWTTGSVANEVNAGPRENFFIDSRTRPGQSGSPVIFYRRQSYITQGGFGATIPEAAALLGIYSGRTDDKADIGFVWWGDEIENIHKSIKHGSTNVEYFTHSKSKI